LIQMLEMIVHHYCKVQVVFKYHCIKVDVLALAGEVT
jgi:hypothetical protein